MSLQKGQLWATQNYSIVEIDLLDLHYARCRVVVGGHGNYRFGGDGPGGYYVVEIMTGKFVASAEAPLELAGMSLMWRLA